MTLCDKHRHQRHCDWETPRDNIRVCSLCCNKASNCCNSCRSPTPTRHQPSPERNSNISSSFRIQSLFKKNRLYIMEEGEFQMDSGEFYVSADVRAAFDKLGYVLVRNLLTGEEVTKLRTCLESSSDIQAHAYGRSDTHGRQSRLCLWNYPGDDLTGVVARSRKVAGTMQSLLGGDEIYHYHSKLMMKDAKTGGSKHWHQDYGYWYNNGCLFPEMGTVFLPVDSCKKVNGCLQVIPGSHKLGRINHVLVGEQAGAEPTQLAQIQKVLPTVHVEMSPGDALFFHCNTLHASARNDSCFRRWAFIVSYNKRRNDPVKKHHHAQYHPLEMLPNSAILECTKVRSTTDKWFMHPDEDASAKDVNVQKG